MKDFETVMRARELTGGATPERYGDRDVCWAPRTGEVFHVVDELHANGVQRTWIDGVEQPPIPSPLPTGTPLYHELDLKGLGRLAESVLPIDSECAP